MRFSFFQIHDLLYVQLAVIILVGLVKVPRCNPINGIFLKAKLLRRAVVRTSSLSMASSPFLSIARKIIYATPEIYIELLAY